MNPNLFRTTLVFGLGLLLAVFLGFSTATGNYEVLFLGIILTLAIIVLVSPGYIGLLALGLLSPFALPIPFIFQFPFLLFILGVLTFKYAVRSLLVQVPEKVPPIALSFPTGLFFGWILACYCRNPVFPNVHGFGEDVTGFRPYLNYALCFAVMVLLGVFIKKREDYLKLIRWLTWLSLFFIAILAPLVFTKSMDVAYLLSYVGVFVTTFDNGFLRFVVLPGFGLLLLSVALLPQIMPLSKTARCMLVICGIVAVILGGNRSSVVMAFAIICGIALLKKRFLRLTGIIIGIASVLFLFNVIGEKLSNRAEEAGFLRILALVNSRIAERTGADNNVIWRKLRWERAMQEIRSNPISGKGYGGVQNAFMWTDWTNFEEARMEIDLASGGVHNGYLACAMAFGIPSLLLFLFAFGRSIYSTAAAARRYSFEDPVFSELFIFICVNLVSFAITIVIGTDLNNPMIWFLIGLGSLAERLRLTKTHITTAETGKILLPIRASTT